MDNTGGGEPDTTDTIDVLKCLRCGQEGCTNVPGRGYQGEGPTMCTEHSTPVMVQIVHLRCEHGDCTARRTFGFDGASARLCAAHKLDGMVDLMKRRSQVCLLFFLAGKDRAGRAKKKAGVTNERTNDARARHKKVLRAQQNQPIYCCRSGGGVCHRRRTETWGKGRTPVPPSTCSTCVRALGVGTPVLLFKLCVVVCPIIACVSVPAPPVELGTTPSKKNGKKPTLSRVGERGEGKREGTQARLMRRAVSLSTRSAVGSIQQRLSHANALFSMRLIERRRAPDCSPPAKVFRMVQVARELRQRKGRETKAADNHGCHRRLYPSRPRAPPSC